MELFVRLDVTTGAILRLDDRPARTPDRAGGAPRDGLPAGASGLRDPGFFDLDELLEARRRGGAWIRRAPAHVTVRLGADRTPRAPAEGWPAGRRTGSTCR